MSRLGDRPAQIPLIKGAVWLEGPESSLALGEASPEPGDLQAVAGHALGIHKCKSILPTPTGAPDHATLLYDLVLVRSTPPAEKELITKAEGLAGAMICLPVPNRLREALRAAGLLELPGTPEDLHLTMLYLGPAAELDDADRAVIQAAVDRVAIKHPPLELSVGGVGKFTSGPDGIPVYVSATGPGLSQLQAALEVEVSKIVDLPSKHGWVPHMTLGYLEADAPIPGVEGKQIPSWTADVLRLQLAADPALDTPLTGARKVARRVAKSDAKRVIYYVLYEPGIKDAHGEEMTADEVAEMMWRSYECRKVWVEHGFDQGLRDIFGKAELAPAEGTVVEHYTTDRPINKGDLYRGAVMEEAINEGAGMEGIRYDSEHYRILANIEHGISLGGRANTRTVQDG